MLWLERPLPRGISLWTARGSPLEFYGQVHVGPGEDLVWVGPGGGCIDLALLPFAKRNVLFFSFPLLV